MLKEKLFTSLKILLLVCCLIIEGGQVIGQKKSTFTTGIGFPELINIGIKHQIMGQAKIGLEIGYWPPFKSGFLSWGNLFSFSGDFNYHFAGSSDFSDLRPWYGRIGLSTILGLGGYTVSYLRIGRDFNFDEDFGISIDAGIGVQFIDEPYIVPAFGLCYFFKF